MGFKDKFRQYRGGRYLLWMFIMATILGITLGLINVFVVSDDPESFGQRYWRVIQSGAVGLSILVFNLIYVRKYRRRGQGDE